MDKAKDNWVLHVSILERKMQHSNSYRPILKITVNIFLILSGQPNDIYGRKGFLIFNLMVICDFDMCFMFIYIGRECSMHDTRVFLQLRHIL
uniref:Uncharacterized protein n=1 Tax=Lactuca sativa TaxID=4236 RepID=A0A9R1WRN3_LACSA|nr:hypothetical protein LSAT_V11C100034370 [Lactuca sativa]